ncbi:unnamed protein product, partial [Ectocarpus sp. 12 AP-2014]
MHRRLFRRPRAEYAQRTTQDPPEDCSPHGWLTGGDGAETASDRPDARSMDSCISPRAPTHTRTTSGTRHQHPAPRHTR